MGTRITGSTKLVDVLVALGLRSAGNLGRDAGLADLAPGLAQATERLAKARDVRKAAANDRWLTRKAMEAAERTVTDAIRAAQHHALEACDGVKGDAAYRALFPDGLKVLMGGSSAPRELALQFLATRLAADPEQAQGAKRMAEALAARQAATDGWKQAEVGERTAVRALAAEALAFQKAFSAARHQAIARLQDLEAVREFFPTLAPKDRAVPETEPPGNGKGKAEPVIQPIAQGQHAA
jgi:hypothetical protein